MIKRVTFHRFKQFRDTTVDLLPESVSLLAGGNNSGKSTVLHGLAIWEFCRTAIERVRGPSEFLAATAAGQGLGLGDDEFSPILVPSLKHLWTNLRTQREGEPDGYTLQIGCHWDAAGHERYLEFGLSLANDRLFIKRTGSTLVVGDPVPRIAYLPPFAGITAREPRVAGAIRRRRIGEGLAGAILRNLLLDLYNHNQAERKKLRGDKSKISDPDLRTLRETDPWELLQDTMRTVFSAELIVSAFDEEYNSYIQVDVVKGSADKYKLTRFPNYSTRDLMVEGSGFLQWLSVFALATSPEINVLLFDEPDAHLHVSLQERLLESLAVLASKSSKQVLLATHSSEILRTSTPTRILHLKGSKGGKYLSEEHHKVGLLAGLGSDYAPRIDRLKHTKRLLFLEGKTTDPQVLKALGLTLAIPWPTQAVEWITPASQKERKQLFLALKEEIPEMRAVSLRDRDDEPVDTVGPGLVDKAVDTVAHLSLRKWKRRHIESYLVWPPALAAVTGRTEEDIRAALAEKYALAIPETFVQADAPQPLIAVDGKAVLRYFGADPVSVAQAMPAEAIPHDVRTFLQELTDLLAEVPIGADPVEGAVAIAAPIN